MSFNTSLNSQVFFKLHREQLIIGKIRDFIDILLFTQIGEIVLLIFLDGTLI